MKTGCEYGCIDADNNAWQCSECGHIAVYEADGPYENGWDFCPHCGRKIEPAERDEAEDES